MLVRKLEKVFIFGEVLKGVVGVEYVLGQTGWYLQGVVVHHLVEDPIINFRVHLLRSFHVNVILVKIMMGHILPLGRCPG